jgi:hypothetical protein
MAGMQHERVPSGHTSYALLPAREADCLETGDTASGILARSCHSNNDDDARSRDASENVAECRRGLAFVLLILRGAVLRALSPV